MSFYSSEDIKNELLEPSVHNSNSTSGRSEFRIKGDVLPSLKLLNTGDYNSTPSQIKRWNKAGGKVLQGLIRRREAEALLFEGKEWYEV